jgi:D-lactate dehydrogenase (cytochrome)
MQEVSMGKSQQFMPLDSRNIDYLTDESLMSGYAESISFPKNEHDVIGILQNMDAHKINVTIQGARTGLSGGAVPQGGHIVNLSEMKSISNLCYEETSNTFVITVQSGLTLGELNEAIARRHLNIPHMYKDCDKALRLFKSMPAYFFPPDPTETLASVGGMINCNASGACSFAYGSIRDYVRRVKIVFADGSTKEFRRGGEKCSGYQCSVSLHARTLDFELPDYNYSRIKNAAGYCVKEDMELVDLFVGSEGTLGVITEADLLLVPAPKVKYGCVCFFTEFSQLMKFEERLYNMKTLQVIMAALEYIDGNALQLIAQMRTKISSFNRIPEFKYGYCGAIYFELHGEDETIMMGALESIVSDYELCGGNLDEAYIATVPDEMQKLKLLRHAVPESANALMAEFKQKDNSLTTICTDLAVPHSHLEEMMAMYYHDLNEENIRYIMYGHIGNNHLHVNILPENENQYRKGLVMYHNWMKKIIVWQGTISAEHGIGKQKSILSEDFLGQSNIKKLLMIKRQFDPNMILNKGNIFYTVPDAGCK